MNRRNTLLVALGMVMGLLLGVMVMAPKNTDAAARSQYKVERLDGIQVRDPAALQEILEQRATDGWLLQALDHETVFRDKAIQSPRVFGKHEPRVAGRGLCKRRACREHTPFDAWVVGQFDSDR